jgi:flagellar biosynthetic protein FliR
VSPLLTAIPLDGPVLPALLVFARASGMLHGAPVLSAKAVPVPLRLGIAAALTLLLTPTIGAPTSDMPLPRFAWLALGEVLFGLALGFAAR